MQGHAIACRRKNASPASAVLRLRLSHLCVAHGADRIEERIAHGVHHPSVVKNGRIDGREHGTASNEGNVNGSGPNKRSKNNARTGHSSSFTGPHNHQQRLRGVNSSRGKRFSHKYTSESVFRRDTKYVSD